MRAILGLRSDSMVATKTLAGTSAIPSSRRPFTKRNASKPKQNRGTEEHPTPYEAAASPAKGGTEKFQRQGAGGGEERNRLDEILSGFVVTAGMTTKPDASGSFAGQIRVGKVRASVRGHGVQPGARTKAARSAPPRRQRHGTTRGHAVKVAPCASCDRAPLRAVKPACATARGSGDFRSGSRVLGAACNTAQAGTVCVHTRLTIKQF